MWVSLFTDVRAKSFKQFDINWDEFVEKLINPSEYVGKQACPLITLSRLGTERTQAGSFRHAGNIKTSTGCEIDIDKSTMQPSEARDVLALNGIKAFIYTSPSHTPAAPRFRVLSPFSTELPPAQRRELVGRINAVLGGIADPSSYNLSQSFYIGRVAGSPYEAYVTEGEFIDRIGYITPIYPAGVRDSAAIAPPAPRTIEPRTVEELRDALRSIPADDRDVWVAVGIALSDAGDAGRDLWLEWSATSPKHNPDADAAQWGTFRPDRTGFAAVFSRAQALGWINPAARKPVDLTDVFAPIPRADPIAVTLQGRIAQGSKIVPLDKQIEFFKGHVYVAELKAILSPTAFVYDKEQFNDYFREWRFVSDMEGKMAKSPWEAFTGCSEIVQPKVLHAQFRPDLDPNAIWEEHDEIHCNKYRELGIRRLEGDVQLFSDHLAKVLPNKRDRNILLAYMAAIVQHKGVKFQWVPILQGCEGNGKSLFSWCVAAAVGSTYSHFARPSELSGQFNSWLLDKIFIGVEDIWYPEGRNEIIETLKPMITNSKQPIRAMQKAERTMDVCANFLINSNHKDAIKKTANDRRWCVMFCAQQEYADMVRDGMDDAYFRRLYGWLKKDGYAMVSEFLHTYEIPAEFGLDCLLSRAPLTSSTTEAIESSRGTLETEVLEAVESHRRGFCGGWIVSTDLAELIKNMRLERAVPRTKHRELMKSLGYDWHPSLQRGRLSCGDRSVVYCRTDRTDLHVLRTSAAIHSAVTAAQVNASAGLVGVFAAQTVTPH